MTVAAVRPGASPSRTSRSATADPGSTSPRSSPRRRTPTTCTWSRTRPACTPSCASSPTRRRRPRRHAVVATPRLLDLDAAATGRDRPRLRVAGHRAAARAGARPAHRRRRRRPDPVQRHLLLPRPGRRRRTCSPPTRPAAATGSPCWPARVPTPSACEALGSRRTRLTVTADGEPGRSRSRSSTAPAGPTAAAGTFDEVVEAARTRVRRVRRRGRALARRRHPGRRTRRLRAVVGHRRPGRVRHPARRADVQALDGQGLELGPLLQRPRPGRRPARAGLATSSSCPSTTRTTPAPCPTRSPTPRSSTTSSNRPSTAGRCGQLRRPPARAARPAGTGRDVRPAGALDRLLARPRRRAPATHLPHYQHGNDSGWDNATTFDPRRVVIETADLAAFLVLQLRELADLAAELGRAGDAAGGPATADRIQRRPAGRAVDGRPVRRPRRRTPATTWASASLLDLMPIVLGDDLPGRGRATCWPTGSRPT